MAPLDGPGEGPDIRIRPSTATDAPALERLAQLDGAATPGGRFLLVEEAGELRAAMPLAGGSPIADPFHRTERLVAMLALAAERLAPTPPAPRRRHRLSLPSVRNLIPPRFVPAPRRTLSGRSGPSAA